jgi:hypothetical protein
VLIRVRPPGCAAVEQSKCHSGKRLAEIGKTDAAR